VNGQVKYNQQTASDRPALLEMNGVVYVAFGSYSDADPYHAKTEAPNLQIFLCRRMYVEMK
jgi:hypothetical protein